MLKNTPSLRVNNMRKTCFLCGKDGLRRYASIKTKVPQSKRPIEAVLQHLGNCLKTKLVFQSRVSICISCYQELVDYDTLMVNLLASQKQLTQQLHRTLTRNASKAFRLSVEDNLNSGNETGSAKLILGNDDDVEIVEDENQPWNAPVDTTMKSENETREEFISIEADMQHISRENDEVGFEILPDNVQDTAADAANMFDNDDDDDDDDLEEDDDDEELSVVDGLCTSDEEYENVEQLEGDEPVNRPKRPKTHDCTTCGIKFNTRMLLQEHAVDVHKQKSFRCQLCGVQRRDEEYLELHMNVHEGKTENECRYCDKTFARPMSTLRHMRKHWDRKKYQCEKCGERFSLDNMLYNHRMKHEAEENPLICSVCNQSFKTRKTYTHHMFIHMENRPRHNCSICSKSFTERYTLKMHMKTHGATLPPARTKNRIVKTTTTTNTKSPLPSQMTQEGGQQQLRETEEAVIALVTDLTSEDHSCVICNCKFEHKEGLDLHLQSDHDVILK